MPFNSVREGGEYQFHNLGSALIMLRARRRADDRLSLWFQELAAASPAVGLPVTPKSPSQHLLCSASATNFVDVLHGTGTFGEGWLNVPGVITLPLFTVAAAGCRCRLVLLLASPSTGVSDHASRFSRDHLCWPREIASLATHHAHGGLRYSAAVNPQRDVGPHDESVLALAWRVH